MSINPFSALAAKIYAGLFGAALGLAALQTIRIDGLWFITGLEGKLATVRTELANETAGRATDRADWRRQVEAAEVARVAAERKSQEIASNAQSTRDALAADNSGLRDYIADHRLRDAAGTAPAASAGASADRGTGLPAPSTAGAFVATSEADLVACDADYVYAAGAYEFAERLIASGLGK